LCEKLWPILGCDEKELSSRKSSRDDVVNCLASRNKRDRKKEVTMDSACPKKTREMHNHHIDSTVWNDFRFRDDDIIITTYNKSGTTWMQQIVSQLLFNGRTDIDTQAMSLWIDRRIPPRDVKLAVAEAQTHRRFLKTHLPVDALVFSPKAKYVYIGRDGRDVLWSLFNHHSNAADDMYKALNESPGLIGPPLGRPPDDVREYWHTWLEKDGFPYWSFWDNVRSWWAIRNLPNIVMVHFDVLKRNMPEEIRRIARFLDISIDETKWDAIVEHCSFDWMREHGEKIVPLGGAAWKGGIKTFMNKGTNGRWRGTLTEEESAEYEAKALAELGPECAHWLATGELVERTRD
jgi:aryl sulfotransferase